MLWCCCVFVHSRNPLLEVRGWRSLCGQKSSRCQSVPLGTWLGWGGVEGKSFPLHWIHLWESLPTKTSSNSEGSASKLLYKMFFLMNGELPLETVELKTPQQKKTMDLSETTIFCFIKICLVQYIFAVARWDQPCPRTQLFFLQFCAKVHRCSVNFLFFHIFS